MKKAIIALYHNIIRTNAHAQIKQKLWGNIDISAPPPLQIWGTCLPVPLGSMPMAPSIRNFSFSVPNFMQINYCIILILPDGYQWVKKLAIHIRHLHRKKQLSSVVGLESTPGLESIFFGLRLGLGLEFLGLELGP